MKHTHWQGLFMLMLAAMLLASCGPTGSGTVVEEDIPIGHFEAIRLDGIGDVHLIQGEGEMITVRTDDNYVDNVAVMRQGTELVVRTKGIVNPTDLVIEVHYQELTRLRSEGLMAIELTDYDGDELSIFIEAGSISASGTLTKLNLQSSGIASFDGSDLMAEQAIIEAADVSHVVVRSAGTMSIATRDSATVEYSDEADKSAESSAGGSIVRH